MSNFSEAKIKAVAEHSWWKKTSKKELAETYDLTVGLIEELLKMPKYQKYIEKLMLGQRSPENFEKWILHPAWKGEMPQRFAQLVKIDPSLVPGMIERVRQAHTEIAAGKKKTPMIIFNPNHPKVDTSDAEVIGCSDHWEFVYLYYFSADKKSSTATYPCKIGKTKNIREAVPCLWDNLWMD